MKNRASATKVIASVGFMGIGVMLAAFPAAAQTINADECANATVISGTGLYTFDTRNATPSAFPPPFNGSITMNYDVWARWTAPQTGWLTLDTCPGGSFGVFSVYRGGDCNTMQPYAVGDWNPACAGDTGSFWVEQGQAYTFRLDVSRRVSQFRLSYSTPFPGDECFNAIDLGGTTGIVAFDNSGATSQYLPADPYQYIQNDVWYRWTAPAAGRYYIHSCSTMLFSSDSVWLFDNQCPVVSEPITANNGAAGCDGARIDFVAQQGRVYLIRFGSTNEYARITNGGFEIVSVDGGGGGGETIVVTTTYDVVDFGGAQNFAALPGPNGHVSFREACIAANNTPGPQRIEFNVPQSEWYYPITTFPYAALINAHGDAFMLTDNETVIDGATQTANVGDTNPNGPDVGFWNWNPNAGGSPNIIIDGDDCLAKDMLGVGMMGYSFWLRGDRNRIIGCQLTQGIRGDVSVRGDDNVVGGTEPGEANRIAGLRVEDGAQRTLIVGNRLIGVSVSGGAAGTRIGGPSVAERNIIGGAGGYCCEGVPTGSQVGVSGEALGTIIENNYIGVAADGVTVIPQVGPTGISISSAHGTIVRGNVVSECFTEGQNHYNGVLFGVGISVAGNAAGTVVQGNLIGTDASGQAPIRNLVGIRVAGNSVDGLYPVDTLIGGEEPGQGNLVAFSEENAIVVWAGVTGVRILGNAVRDNALLGIDLNEDGVTLNDPQDIDSGANDRQNFPVVAAATTTEAATTVSGTLHSTPGRTFRVELFASPSCDPSGHGEGHEFLGSTVVTTDGAGDAAFMTDAAPTVVGWVVTATATDTVAGNTSEFSACRVTEAGDGACAADFNGDGFVTAADVGAFLTAYFNDLATGSTDADFDGNGVTNPSDVGAFLTQYFAEC